MSVIKRTRIYESVNFEIRAEMFNVFNRTNFGFGGIPARNIGSTDPANVRFGVPNGPRSGPRNIQIVAKINF
jgi:hypothetical protein